MKKILLPLQPGDRVVWCPKHTSVSQRGRAGTIKEVHDNLTISIQWDEVDPGPKFDVARSYMARKEQICHSCIHRATHIAGGLCPMSWKEVKSIHETEVENAEC